MTEPVTISDPLRDHDAALCRADLSAGQAAAPAGVLLGRWARFRCLDGRLAQSDIRMRTVFVAKVAGEDWVRGQRQFRYMLNAMFGCGDTTIDDIGRHANIEFRGEADGNRSKYRAFCAFCIDFSHVMTWNSTSLPALDRTVGRNPVMSDQRSRDLIPVR